MGIWRKGKETLFIFGIITCNRKRSSLNHKSIDIFGKNSTRSTEIRIFGIWFDFDKFRLESDYLKILFLQICISMSSLAIDLLDKKHCKVIIDRWEVGVVVVRFHGLCDMYIKLIRGEAASSFLKVLNCWCSTILWSPIPNYRCVS